MTAFVSEHINKKPFSSLHSKNKISFFETKEGKKLINDIERLRDKKIVENERKENYDKTN